MISITDGDNNITTINRDSSANPTGIVAPFGQLTILELDPNGYLSTVTNPRGESYAMAYTPDGLLISFTDPRNNTSAFAYDPLGRLKQDDNAGGGGLTLTRAELADGRIATTTTALGRATSHQVRNLSIGDRERIHTQPDGTVSTDLEKTDGTRIFTAADGSVTTLVESPDPRFGMQSPLPKSVTVSTGGLTSIVTLTRTTSLSDPDNLLSLTSMTDQLSINGRLSSSIYNAATRVFTNTSAAGRQSTRTIDTLGRTTQIQVNGLLPVINSYEQKGRLETITVGTGADKRLMTFGYNPAGFLSMIADPLNHTTHFEYDLAGRITKQTLPDTREILYSYDANGNLASLTPPGRQAHVFNYSPVNLVDQYTPPDIGISTTSTVYQYNLDKQLTNVTRPDSKSIAFTYDVTTGKLNKQTTPLGDTLYGYDPITGKLTTTDTPDGVELTYGFNGALLSQVRWSGPITGSTDFSYDNDFRISDIKVNGVNSIIYQYDNDSLLTQAGALMLGRDTLNGLLTGTSLGLVTDSYVYNGFGEVTNYLTQYNSSNILGFQYSYNKAGRVTQKDETTGGILDSFEYAYDTVGRLTEVKKNSIVQASYGYDSNGNRTTINGVVIATYDDQDRLLTYAAAGYDYNANGELESKTESGVTTTYDYDVLGNLRQIVLPGSVSIDYIIDGQNRRIGKKINGVLTQDFLYQDQLNPVAELDGSGNVVSRFIYADKGNIPAYMVKDGITYRIISDHLGSPRMVVNTADGSVAQRMDYDVWGNVVSDTNPSFQPFGFAGGIYDLHTGFIRFGVRDYDPLTGRWTAKDPILFDGGDANLYGYVLNDPVNFIDPDGQIRFKKDFFNPAKRIKKNFGITEKYQAKN